MRRHVVAPLLCTLLVVVPLVSLRNPHRSTRATSLTAGADLTHRSAPRASRSSWRTERSTTTTPEAAAASVTLVTAAVAPTTTTPSTVRRTTTTTSTKAVVRAKPTTTTTARRATPTTAAPAPAPSGNSESGKASWYDAAPDGTCAHKTLPMGTIVKVTNTSNGKSTTCRVADRGPYHDGWIIDLAKSTFAQIAPTSAGVISVRIEW